MVINYKRLNSFTVLDGYFLPNKESLIKEVQEKFVFSKFDCKAGYGQIKMSEESISLTALSTPQGQYKWLVMPFGLTNAPQIFQQRMDNIFKQYSTFCQVYIYDIIVFNKNKKEHKQHLQAIAKEIRNHDIILSEKKMELEKESIDLLGITIDKGQIIMQEHVLKKSKDFLTN